MTRVTESSARRRIFLSLNSVPSISCLLLFALSMKASISSSSFIMGMLEALALVKIRGLILSRSRYCAAKLGRKDPMNLLLFISSLSLSLCSRRIMGRAEDSRSFSSTGFTKQNFLISSMLLNITAKGLLSLCLASRSFLTASGSKGFATRLKPPTLLKAITPPSFNISAALSSICSSPSGGGALSAFAGLHISCGPQSRQEIV